MEKVKVLVVHLVLYVIFVSVINCQDVDLDELATTLLTSDIPVRLPFTRFKFNKDRTSSGVSTRIIGGGVATAHEYPFQVALFIYVGGSQYFCGGSLISNEWVLSAAHCVENADYIIVFLGSHNLSQSESSRVIYNATEFIIHESWNSLTLQNDVSLIKLPVTVTLNEYIDVVPIASNESNSYTAETARCLGWGRTILGTLSTILRYVDAEVISNEECSTYMEYAEYIIDHHLCTSGVGFIGSCNGDSGGPLIIDGIQVGIVSFGYNDCAAGYPSVYTRISSFYSWMNNSIENYTSSSSSISIMSNGADDSRSNEICLVMLCLAQLLTRTLLG